MTLTALAHVGLDLVALAILIGALYVPRHSRRDLMAAYIGVNVGVLAVTLLLATASVGAGLGLGLFGVLSIIRLRSTELAQHEVAYFFAALALGLLGGLEAGTAPTAVLMGLLLVALWIGDHPRILRRNRHQVIMLDRAIADEAALTAHLETLLGARVQSLEVQRLDLVNDTTLVDVRYQLHALPGQAPADDAREARPGAAPVALPAQSPRLHPVSPAEAWSAPQDARAADRDAVLAGH